MTLVTHRRQVVCNKWQSQNSQDIITYRNNQVMQDEQILFAIIKQLLANRLLKDVSTQRRPGYILVNAILSPLVFFQALNNICPNNLHQMFQICLSFLLALENNFLNFYKNWLPWLRPNNDFWRKYAFLALFHIFPVFSNLYLKIFIV